jgi:hypothetical protein
LVKGVSIFGVDFLFPSVRQRNNATDLSALPSDCSKS